MKEKKIKMNLLRTIEMFGFDKCKYFLFTTPTTVIEYVTHRKKKFPNLLSWK